MAGEIFYDDGVPGWRIVVPDTDVVDGFPVEVYSDLFCLAEGPVLSFIANVHDQPDSPLVFHIALDLAEKAGRQCFFALDRHGRVLVETVAGASGASHRTIIEPARDKLDLWLVAANSAMEARPENAVVSAADAYWLIMRPFAEEAQYLAGWDALAENARTAPPARLARPTKPVADAGQDPAGAPLAEGDDVAPDDLADDGADDGDTPEEAAAAAASPDSRRRPGIMRRVLGALLVRAVIAVIMLGAAGVMLFSLGADIILRGIDPSSMPIADVVANAAMLGFLIIGAIVVLAWRTRDGERQG